MIYIKRIVFLIVAFVTFLLSSIPFLLSTLFVPIYCLLYYVNKGYLDEYVLLPYYVAEWYGEFINKINPN
jgi:hypothetical protein